jgi:hypothetical protein
VSQLLGRLRQEDGLSHQFETSLGKSMSRRRRRRKVNLQTVSFANKMNGRKR